MEGGNPTPAMRWFHQPIALDSGEALGDHHQAMVLFGRGECLAGGKMPKDGWFGYVWVETKKTSFEPQKKQDFIYLLSLVKQYWVVVSNLPLVVAPVPAWETWWNENPFSST